MDQQLEPGWQVQVNTSLNKKLEMTNKTDWFNSQKRKENKEKSPVHCQLHSNQYT